MAVTMKNAVFWGRKIRERRTSMSRWLRTAVYPEDGGDTFLRNIGSHKIYTVPHPRGWDSSSITMFLTMQYFTLTLTSSPHRSLECSK
jgi:hypothetical protein